MMIVIRRDSGDSDGHISWKFSNVGERSMHGVLVYNHPNIFSPGSFLVFGTWLRHYWSMQFMNVVFPIPPVGSRQLRSKCWRKSGTGWEGDKTGASIQIHIADRYKRQWSRAAFLKLWQLQTTTWVVSAYSCCSAGLSCKPYGVATFFFFWKLGEHL